MKARRSVYNLIVGLVSQIITIGLGILIPRLFLIKFGSEVNGLISSINQLFVYVALLEAGVGLATLQALYKPISLNDKDNVNSILSATSIYYKKTGFLYVLAVTVLALIYPFIVKANINYITVVAIILLTGIGGSLNYFFQGKYKLLLDAEGKGYVISLITTTINILSNGVKVVLLLLNYNIIIIQGSFLIITILQMMIYDVFIRKNYSWLDLKVKPNYQAIEQKNSVLIHQISSLIFSNTDVIVLTIFCGLKVVSIYVIYNLVFNIIDSLISTFNNSVLFALGQSYSEDKHKYSKIYDSYETYFMAGGFSLLAVTYILILPFIKLYTAGVTDINYIDYKLPIFFILLRVLSYARMPAGNTINIAGHFKQTQNRSMIESIINIVGSLLFVNIYGIYGVLIGTIAALLYRTIDIIIYANKKIMNRSPWMSFKRVILDIIIFILIIGILNNVNMYLNSYIQIIMYAVILMTIILLFYFSIVSVFDKKVYSYTMSYFRTIVGRYSKKTRG